MVGNGEHVGFAPGLGADAPVLGIELQLLDGGVKILQLLRREPPPEISPEPGKILRGRRADDDGSPAVTRVGFIGAGRMGAPMIARLVDAGHDVRVLVRSPEK